MTKRIDNDFYKLRATEMAPALLGKILCHEYEGDIYRVRITETEVYFGEDDTACHASKGKTERTKVLYEPGGIAYVYLCYGIHNLFNIVSGEQDFPEACLIRGVEGFDGPGKLTKAIHIDRTLNGEDMRTSDKLWLEDDGAKPKYKAGKRIGIDYAAPKDRNAKWRYYTV